MTEVFRDPVLREEGLLERSLIHGTDINREALVQAELGAYPEARLAEFDRNHRLAGGTDPLCNHSATRYDVVVFDASLRKRLVFSEHSLAVDQPCAEVQLVSCQNVLIYFERELRARLAFFEVRSVTRVTSVSEVRSRFVSASTRWTSNPAHPGTRSDEC